MTKRLQGLALYALTGLFVTGCSSEPRSSSPPAPAPVTPITIRTAHDGIFKVQETAGVVTVTNEAKHVLLQQKAATPTFNVTMTEKALLINDTNGLQVGAIPLKTHPVLVTHTVAGTTTKTITANGSTTIITNGHVVTVKDGNITVNTFSSNTTNTVQVDNSSVTNSDNVTKTYRIHNASHVVNGDNDTIELQGNCTQLTVNGDNNTITVTGQLTHVTFNGDNNHVQRLGSQQADYDLTNNGNGNIIGS